MCVMFRLHEDARQFAISIGTVRSPSVSTPCDGLQSRSSRIKSTSVSPHQQTLTSAAPTDQSCTFLSYTWSVISVFNCKFLITLVSAKNSGGLWAVYSIRGQRCSIATVYIAPPPTTPLCTCPAVNSACTISYIFFHHQTYQIKLHFSFSQRCLICKSRCSFFMPRYSYSLEPVLF